MLLFTCQRIHAQYSLRTEHNTLISGDGYFKMGMLHDHFLKQFYERPSRAGRFQKLFQKGSAPVYLKGSSDALIYRGAMGLTVIGLGITFYGVFLMATNQMTKATKKE